jgi:hypothetical protein
MSRTARLLPGVRNILLASLIIMQKTYFEKATF